MLNSHRGSLRLEERRQDHVKETVGVTFNLLSMHRGGSKFLLQAYAFEYDRWRDAQYRDCVNVDGGGSHYCIGDASLGCTNTAID